MDDSPVASGRVFTYCQRLHHTFDESGGNRVGDPCYEKKGKMNGEREKKGKKGRGLEERKGD
jgi:hypothetical protein